MFVMCRVQFRDVTWSDSTVVKENTALSVYHPRLNKI